MPSCGEIDRVIIDRIVRIGERYGVDAHRLPGMSTHLLPVETHSLIMQETALIREMPISDTERSEIEALENKAQSDLAELLKHIDDLVQLMACMNQTEYLGSVLRHEGVGPLVKAIDAMRPYMTQIDLGNREILELYIEECGRLHA